MDFIINFTIFFFRLCQIFRLKYKEFYISRSPFDEILLNGLLLQRKIEVEFMKQIVGFCYISRRRLI
jgi:hypothetical protein